MKLDFISLFARKSQFITVLSFIPHFSQAERQKKKIKNHFITWKIGSTYYEEEKGENEKGEKTGEITTMI